ncbi:MAG: zinc ribbon domain-containing protein [Nitrospirae bacterium]|nr:zinc ribbon domain-containing protein [Nitrospirota bacterium]
MALQPFTENFSDNSTEAGFQCIFFCDLCRDGYKTRFIESKTYKKKGLFRMLGSAASLIGDLTGHSGLGYNVERGADTISARFTGMSPEWHKEHEAAFELAQNEAKEHFHRCPKCRKYVCESDWNEQEGLCVGDAPRMNVEVAAAKAGKMVKDIQSAAEATTVFTGKIESKQTICPQCNKPAGEGKFCGNCGATLAIMKCPKCGAGNQSAVRFCGECGTNLK